jgi:hypothetical protein
MSDISIRIPYTDSREKYLEDNYVSLQLLPGFKDIMYKPVGVDLKAYHPNDVCLRLRQFSDTSASLTEIKTIKNKTGYTDEKTFHISGTPNDMRQKAIEMGYEEWGNMSVISFEYKLEIDDEVVTVLSQSIDPIDYFYKIESPSEKSLDKLLKILQVKDSEKIQHNAAVMLAEKFGLI